MNIEFKINLPPVLPYQPNHNDFRMLNVGGYMYRDLINGDVSISISAKRSLQNNNNKRRFLFKVAITSSRLDISSTVIFVSCDDIISDHIYIVLPNANINIFLTNMMDMILLRIPSYYYAPLAPLYTCLIKDLCHAYYNAVLYLFVQRPDRVSVNMTYINDAPHYTTSYIFMTQNIETSSNAIFFHLTTSNSILINPDLNGNVLDIFSATSIDVNDVYYKKLIHTIYVLSIKYEVMVDDLVSSYYIYIMDATHDNIIAEYYIVKNGSDSLMCYILVNAIHCALVIKFNNNIK